MNDILLLSPSEGVENQFEYVTIQFIFGLELILYEKIKFFHYGSEYIIESELGDIDMRTSVGHLSRNIKISSAADTGLSIITTSVEYQKGNLEGSISL